MDIEKIKEAFLVLVKAATEQANADAAAASTSGNPYGRFLLPGAVANRQPGAPPYDVDEAQRIAKDALDRMSGPDLLNILKSVGNVITGLIL